MGLTVGSLFSGIGGLDLGLERAGMEVIWQSEIDPYACKVLSKHWPEVVNHGNIKEINWQEVERPDVICGGYPCQPFSTAGKRRGEEDPRHLWPWVRTAIGELRPRYAILENVRGHLSMGGLSVIGELASIGYDAQWRVVSAASVGANHRRDRIIIVAYPSGERCLDNGVGIFSSQERLNALGFLGQSSSNVANTKGERCETGGQSERKESAHTQPPCSCKHVAHANLNSETDGRQCEAVQSQSDSRRNDGRRGGSNFGEVGLGSTGKTSRDVADPNLRETGRWDRSLQPDRGKVFEQGNLIGGEEGYAGWQWWQTEPDVGRVAHGVPRRVDRLRGLGNAVVPQVAEVIGRLVISDYQRRED